MSLRQQPGAVPAPAADLLMVHQGVTYQQVPMQVLTPDTEIAFPLYLQPAPGHLVLLSGPGFLFTERHHAGLCQRGNATNLWLRESDATKYDQHVERHLSSLLSVPGLDVSERASLVTSAARASVAAAMADPRHSQAAVRTRRVAAEMVGLIVRERDAFLRMAALMERDYDTVRHSINVTVFATGLAHACGVPKHDLEELGQGSLLHDIGKSTVPRELLVKGGKYSEDEYLLMQSHVQRGEELMHQEGGVSPLAMTALSQHHERLSGSGYPRKLKSAELHTFGRITAVCDVFHALTSERPYKSALSAADALRLMTTEMASHLDQGLLRTFIRTLGAPASAATSRTR